jgi:hypothetical protein
MRSVSQETVGSRSGVDGARRAIDVLTMHRLSRRADGAALLVRWLAGRTGCRVALLDHSGAVLVAAREWPAAVTSPVREALAVVVGRGVRSFVADDGSGGVVVLQSVDVPGGEPAPVLALVGPRQDSPVLAADAAALVGTSWWVEQTRRRRQHAEVAEGRGREAVLHLLMAGHVATAHQVASTLPPTLPNPASVHIVECPPGRRDDAIGVCAEVSGGSAWVVRCPVYARHLIVLASAVPGADRGRLAAGLASGVPGCTVGSSEAVALRDMAVGYEQATHALAVARGRAERWARFDAATDLPSIVGPMGLSWANELLAALVTYVPARATDPDGQELIVTARSWLAFGNLAVRHLKIHRNTLLARLRRIEDLLGIELARLGHQAALNLALRIMVTPRSAPARDAEPPGAPDLDAVLRLPGVQQWAASQLRPLRHDSRAAGLERTLRAWLANDCRLSATAGSLGISVPGARKRLLRLEQVLGRSLLHLPDARHDLWMAVCAADLAGPDR